MEGTGSLLADIPGFGRVFDCGGCGYLHLTVGPVSLTLTTESLHAIGSVDEYQRSQL